MHELEATQRLSRDLAALLAAPEAIQGPRRLVRLTSPVPQVDLLAWLRKQPEPNKVFWSDREHAFAVAGIGSASTKTGRSARGVDGLFEEMRSEISSTHKGLRYYGGFRFDLGTAGESKWGPFGTYHFVVPQFELRVQHPAARYGHGPGLGGQGARAIREHRIGRNDL